MQWIPKTGKYFYVWNTEHTVGPAFWTELEGIKLLGIVLYNYATINYMEGLKLRANI